MNMLLEFVTGNFWVLLLILAMLFMKEHRMGGLILLVVQALWGTVVPVFIITVVICVIWELWRWSTYGGMLHRGDMHNNWVPQQPKKKPPEGGGGPPKRPPGPGRPPSGPRRDPDYDDAG